MKPNPNIFKNFLHLFSNFALLKVVLSAKLRYIRLEVAKIWFVAIAMSNFVGNVKIQDIMILNYTAFLLA